MLGIAGSDEGSCVDVSDRFWVDVSDAWWADAQDHFLAEVEDPQTQIIEREEATQARCEVCGGILRSRATWLRGFDSPECEQAGSSIY